MSNEQILTKAIEQAIANGWRPHAMTTGDPWEVQGMITLNLVSNGHIIADHMHLLYSHSFAKALWGDKPLPRITVVLPALPDGAIVSVKAWQLHLQQMVIADDPIAYLGDNL